LAHLLAALLTASLRVILKALVTLPEFKALLMTICLDFNKQPHFNHLLKTLVDYKDKGAPTLSLAILRATLTLLLLMNFLLMFLRTFWSLKVTLPLLMTLTRYLLLTTPHFLESLLRKITWVMVSLEPSLALLILLIRTHLYFL
jgi:hypothetical protein